MTSARSLGMVTPTLLRLRVEWRGRLRYPVTLLARSKPRRWCKMALQFDWLCLDRAGDSKFRCVATLLLIAAVGGCATAPTDTGAGTNNNLGGGNVLPQPDVPTGGKDTSKSDAGSTTDTVNDSAVEDSGTVEDTCTEDCGSTDEDAAVDVAAADTYVGPICQTSGACKSLEKTPFCAIALKQCVECLTDFNCGDGKICDEKFNCKNIACDPGKTWCDGQFLATCNETGDGVSVDKCPGESPLCFDGKCGLCEPGKTFCAPNAPGQTVSKAVLKCSDDGTSADVLKSCNGVEKCTLSKDLKPYCNSCVPGDKVCQGDNAMECADDGSGFAIFEKCGEKGLACQGGLCVDPCAEDVKSNTNVGCDYWAVDLDNAKVPNGSGGYYDAQNSQFSVIVSNTKDKAISVTVEAGTGQKQTYTVQGNGLKIIDLPDPLWKVPPLNQDNTNVNKNVYRIKSDQPIVAYQFNPLQNFDVFSNDASLLLPSNVVGTEYWVVSRTQAHDNLRSYFTVVAVQPGNTIVTVVSTAKTQPGPGIQAMKPGDKMDFTLQQGQVLNIETNAVGQDPTGTYIKASARVAVFAGSEASNSPDTDKCIGGKCQFQGWTCTTNADCPKTCCADHMEEQLFPVNAWGKQYYATKLKKRGKEKDAWRFVASENDTVISTSPAQAPIPKLAKGAWFEIESDQDFVVTANNPIQVTQFMASSHAPNPNNDECSGSYLGQKVCGYNWNTKQTPISCNKHADCPNIAEVTDAKIGDPDMINTPAVEQYLDNYRFLVPNKYTENYVNVVAPVDAVVKIDNAQVPAAQWTVFAPKWQVARLPVNPGNHLLTSTKPVGLVVYGWADYVSYGYPGGAQIGPK